jgi:hypothetical protein
MASLEQPVHRSTQQRVRHQGKHVATSIPSSGRIPFNTAICYTTSSAIAMMKIVPTDRHPSRKSAPPAFRLAHHDPEVAAPYPHIFQPVAERKDDGHDRLKIEAHGHRSVRPGGDLLPHPAKAVIHTGRPFKERIGDFVAAGLVVSPDP